MTCETSAMSRFVGYIDNEDDLAGAISVSSPVHVANDIYTIAQTGSTDHSGDTRISTWQIDSEGNIITKVDDVWISRASGGSLSNNQPALLHFSGEYYVLAHIAGGGWNTSRLSTVRITDAGKVLGIVSGVQVSSGRLDCMRLTRISTHVFALTSGGGNISTYAVSDDGTIAGMIQSHNLPNSDGRVEMVNVHGNVYACVHRWWMQSNWVVIALSTVEILYNGIITDIDTTNITLDSVNNEKGYPRICKVSDEVVLVSWRRGGDTKIATWFIDNDGFIGGELSSTLESFDGDWYKGVVTALVKTSPNYYIVSMSEFEHRIMRVEEDGTIVGTSDVLTTPPPGHERAEDMTHRLAMERPIYLALKMAPDKHGRYFETFELRAEGNKFRTRMTGGLTHRPMH